MKLRTKAAIFFGLLIASVALTTVLYAQYIVGSVFREQTNSSIRSIAEQTESAYFAFVQNMKTRTLDWVSDSTLLGISKGVLDAPAGTPERARLAREFATYVKEKKMPFDKTIFLTDLLDRTGTVIASTDLSRISHDESMEEFTHQAHSFSKTITSKFGEAFTKSIVREEDEDSRLALRATARLAIPDTDGVFQPIDAVLLVHFANEREISELLKGEGSASGGRLTSGEFMRNYRSSDIYMVNSAYNLVTPSRTVQDVSVTRKIATLPSRACFERGVEVNEEYDNDRGTRVIGASMCFPDAGLVLIVEVDKDEIYAPITTLARQISVGGVAIALVGIFIIAFFLRHPLGHIDDIVAVAKRVIMSDFEARVTVHGSDEIGYLATVFNKMIAEIRDDRKELHASKLRIEEKARALEQDIKKHEGQETLMNESKQATLNVLEDMIQTKEKLETEGHRLQTIISSIGDGLILIDGEYRIALINPQALNMLALSPQDAVGKDLRSIMTISKSKKTDILPDEWPTEEMFLTKKMVSVGLDAELSLMTVQRISPLPVTLSVAPLGGGLAGGIIVIHDVTEDRALDDAKSGFISVASHQLRTPLTTIRWYSEMLLSDDAGALTPSQKDFLAEIHGGAERLYQTIDLLLGISRVESGRIKVEKSSVDLDAFTREVAKELALSMDQKKIVFTVAPPAEPISVLLDRLQLRQVVMNLLTNAVRYTNDNGTIEARWARSDDGKEVVYAVRDNGIGIPKAQQSRIFTKFFRAENALQKAPDGSGLGLALVKELVESWGGRAWFETEEGKGTTFYFTIPL